MKFTWNRYKKPIGQNTRSYVQSYFESVISMVKIKLATPLYVYVQQILRESTLVPPTFVLKPDSSHNLVCRLWSCTVLVFIVHKIFARYFKFFKLLFLSKKRTYSILHLLFFEIIHPFYFLKILYRLFHQIFDYFKLHHLFWTRKSSFTFSVPG